MSDGSSRKKRVAVLGGGVGAMSAAYALLSQPGGPEKYDVTIYQLGWRIGGKGASGRNQDPDKGLRIEEHGLHVWMGCYDNAFRMISDAYSACAQEGLTPNSPFPRWDDAFKPQSHVTIFENYQEQWLPWTVEFETNKAVPGTGGVLLSPWEYICMTLKWLVGQLERAEHASVRTMLTSERERRRPDDVQQVLDQGIGGGGGKSHLHDAHDLAHSLDENVHRHTARDHHAIAWLTEDFMKQAREFFRDDFLDNTTLRRLWIMLNLGVASIRGLIAGGAVFHGLDPLDQHEFRDWLAHYGADEMSVWSPPVKALYDLVFAYAQGKADRPNLAAGGAMRTILRICFTYKGAFCFKMQAGMGDTVFTPIYKLLRHCGAKFKFFHKVESLHLTDDKTRIASIDLAVQANVKPEQLAKGGEYEPLIPVTRGGATLLCWPSTPQFDQLLEGDELRDRGINLESSWTDWTNPGHVKLTLGEDFDLVICGISLAGLKSCCSELVEASPPWKRMVNNVQTVQTEAFQVWMNHTAQEMGWDDNERILFGSYPWSGADMTQVEPLEAWPANYQVKNVAYYCRQLADADPIPPPPDPDFPAQQDALVKAHGIDFLNNAIAPIWPKATASAGSHGINWDWVVDPRNRQGEARFDAQYWRANLDPSERYVLSVNDSTQYRIPSDDSGFSNLYLAGDWTRNGLNMGCVEAAVISGFQVSRKISGHPQVIVGEQDLILPSVELPTPAGFLAALLRWLRSLWGTD